MEPPPPTDDDDDADDDVASARDLQPSFTALGAHAGRAHIRN